MDRSPRVSVVMPAHNAEAYVGEAVESILNQTLRDLELIVVNDSSTDGTETIVRRYMENDARVVLENVNVRSAAEARNTALRIARGEWIALLDSDDVAYPDRLEKQLRAADLAPEVVLWGCYMRTVTPEGIKMGAIRVGCRSEEEYVRLDRTKSLIHTFGTAAMFRREHALCVGGFDRRFEPMEDSELWDRLARFGSAAVVPEILQDYRQHDKSLSVKKMELQPKWADFIKQRHAARLRGDELTLEAFECAYEARPWWFKLNGKLRAVSHGYSRRGRIAWARRQYLVAAGAFALMVVTHPLRIVRLLLPGAPEIG